VPAYAQSAKGGPQAAFFTNWYLARSLLASLDRLPPVILEPFGANSVYRTVF
jgi:hypothetical protein